MFSKRPCHPGPSTLPRLLLVLSLAESSLSYQEAPLPALPTSAQPADFSKTPDFPDSRPLGLSRADPAPTPNPPPGSVPAPPLPVPLGHPHLFSALSSSSPEPGHPPHPPESTFSSTSTHTSRALNCAQVLGNVPGLLPSWSPPPPEPDLAPPSLRLPETHPPVYAPCAHSFIHGLVYSLSFIRPCCLPWAGGRNLKGLVTPLCLQGCCQLTSPASAALFSAPPPLPMLFPTSRGSRLPWRPCLALPHAQRTHRTHGAGVLPFLSPLCGLRVSTLHPLVFGWRKKPAALKCFPEK